MTFSLSLVAFALHAVNADSQDRCHPPKVDSKCHAKVMYAMLDGFAQHPEQYVGLTTKSNYRDFQAYSWNVGMYDCPRPCMEHEEACVKFDQSFPCMKDVHWAAFHGIVENPEWYPELRTGAPLKDFALVLYMHGQPGCPRPCDEGEPVGHFVPYQPEADPEDEDEAEESKARRRKENQQTNDEEDDQDVDLEDDEDQSSKKEKKQIVRLAKLLRTQEDRKVVKTVQSQDDNCARPGLLYAPAMAGSFKKSVKSSNECRMHCRGIDGAGHFWFYASLGLCHCAVYGAVKQEVPDVNNLAGPVNCGVRWENVNKETAKLVEAVNSGCFSMNTGFGPAIGEPLPFQAKDPMDCQQQLKSSNAKHFVFTPVNGECRLVAPEASLMPLQDAISGPASCEDKELEVQMKADINQVKVPRATTRRLVIFVGIPSGFMIIGLTITGALISVRRRLRTSEARANLFARNGLLEGLGWDEPCIAE